MNSQDSPQTPAEQVIKRLGGGSKLSREFDISRAGVSAWREAGIPPARMMYLKLKYRKALKGIDLDAATAKRDDKK